MSSTNLIQNSAENELSNCATRNKYINMFCLHDFGHYGTMIPTSVHSTIFPLRFNLGSQQKCSFTMCGFWCESKIGLKIIKPALVLHLHRVIDIHVFRISRHTLEKLQKSKFVKFCFVFYYYYLFFLNHHIICEYTCF